MVDNASHLVREMRETCEVIRNLDVTPIGELSRAVGRNKVLFTGEGSSRIFPAKKVRYDSLRYEYSESLQSEGATQALEYDLHGYSVFAATNSGRTKEVVRLLQTLREHGHDDLVVLTAGEGTPVESLAHRTYHLSAGAEKAVAATKTVVEQALVYDIAFRMRNGKPLPMLSSLADLFSRTLEAGIPVDIRDALAGAGTIYWAGRNDGVAEELTLKTNEIARKPADFLEGTYAVHGIEEVMSAEDVVVVLQPFAEEAEKMSEVLVEGVGLKVIAVSSEPTPFPTITIPEGGDFAPYVELAAGWNLLVETGVALGINLDKPARARKVGNEISSS